jgi:hypothetical protein
MDKLTLKSPLLWLIFSLTLGLAPFNPPHIIGKLQWVAGGAVGMQAMDWFDLFLHGFPFVGLLVTMGIWLGEKSKKKPQESR